MKNSEGKLCVMLDCSRDAVPNLHFLKTFIDDIAKMGYNSLMLYTEDTYKIEGEDYFGYLRGAFTAGEMKEINAYGKTKGIELIPCIQTLAHLGCLAPWYPYSEFFDCNDILLVGDDRTYALIDKMFKTMRDCFDSEYINIGMDEAHFVGLGKYLAKNGYKNRLDILLGHLKKVCEIAEKYNFKPVMWSDMFFSLVKASYRSDEFVEFSEEDLEKVPENVSLCYWDYYSKDEKTYDAMLSSHKQFRNEVWFAGGCWCWSGFAPNNFQSFEANTVSLPIAEKYGIKNVIMTMWGDNGHEASKRSTYPSLFHAAMLYKGITDIKKIDEKFTEIFGLTMEEALAMDKPNLIYQQPTLGNFTGTLPFNPCKFMLYNDCFLGWHDANVTKDGAEKYKKYAEELKKYVKNEKFGYVYDVLYKLCLVLSDKFDLGIKTRAAYKAFKAGDRKELENLIAVYEALPEKVEAFYLAFRKQWFYENKGCGFEVHDARIGGLILRIKDCTVRLKELLDGKIDTIDELELEILPPYNDPEKFGSGENFNFYMRNYTTGQNFV